LEEGCISWQNQIGDREIDVKDGCALRGTVVDNQSLPLPKVQHSQNEIGVLASMFQAVV
jgi:hypothetical protein